MNLEKQTLQQQSTTEKPESLSKTGVYIFFHYPCSDGFGAKYAAWKKFGNGATYFGVNYGQPMPSIPDGSDLYIIDFSYPKDVLRGLQARLNKLVVLDHHKTAQEDLIGEEYAIFDMNKSGAVLAWEYFHPGVAVPTLLEMIQDRDLWKWKIPGSRDVLNYLEIVGDDVRDWDELVPLRGNAYSRGQYVSRYVDKIVAFDAMPDKVKVFELDGLRVGITNCTVKFRSEIGAAVCADKELNVAYSITYWIEPGGVVNLSFRSLQDGGTDVGQIARKFGGGGHKNASGGRTNLSVLAGWLNADV